MALGRIEHVSGADRIDRLEVLEVLARPAQQRRTMD